MTRGALPRVNIIGCGRAGGSLADGWIRSGTVRVGGICNQTLASADLAADRLGEGHAHESVATLGAADFWLFGVPDGAVVSVAESLAGAGRPVAGSVVFHLAGSLGPSALVSLQEKGAVTAVVHPLHAFSRPAFDSERFAGTWCMADGDHEALAALAPLFDALGGRWHEAQIGNRALYHAACTLASNAPRALVRAAADGLAAAGLDADTAHSVAVGLLRDTAADLATRRPGLGLTGPVARGDVDTVRRHLAALPREGADLYRALGLALARLAAESDTDAAALARIRSLLEGRATGT